MLTYTEPRLAPIGNTFLVWGEPPGAQKRSHSYSGYVPHHLRPSLDGPELEPQSRRGGGASPGVEMAIATREGGEETVVAAKEIPRAAGEAEAARDNNGQEISTGKRDGVDVKDTKGRPPTDLRPENVTTLMLRGIPFEIRQHMLLDEIHRSGFAGKLDFFYLPRNFRSGENQGYAFANFTSSAAATEFKRMWRGRSTCAGHAFHMGGLSISVAELQGLSANLEKWANPRLRRVRNPKFRPFVLDSGATRSASSR